MPILIMIPLVWAITLEIQGELAGKFKWKLLLEGGNLMKSLLLMNYLVVMGVSGVSK